MIRTALTAALLSTIALAGPASATQTTEPTHEVKVQKIVAAHHLPPSRDFRKGSTAIALNDGSSYELRNCRLEDSRNCFWDAKLQGNGRGRSFADVKGEVIYVKRGVKVKTY